MTSTTPTRVSLVGRQEVPVEGEVVLGSRLLGCLFLRGGGGGGGGVVDPCSYHRHLQAIRDQPPLSGSGDFGVFGDFGDSC